MTPFAAALLAVAASSSVLAQGRPIQLTIAAGKVGEVCMALQAGDTLAWEFKASAATDFNLQQHVDKQVLMPVERKAVIEDRAQHTVERRNEWCLMWTAPAGQGVTVEGAWRATPK
jgi:hypothetical protein